MRRPARSTVEALTAILLPAAVTLVLYWYGLSRTPDYLSSLFGRSDGDANDLKARLSTALLGMSVLQLLLALWLYRRLPGAGPAPRPVPVLHRIGGLLAFLLSLPIAYHCVTAYGVQLAGTRVAVHSVTGCVLYGAFVAKVVVVRSRRLPGWTLPTVGGLLVVAIALLWYSAALWQLNGQHLPGF